MRSVTSEIRVLEGVFGGPTDQWSQCLRQSTIAAGMTAELRHTPVDLQRSVIFENDLFDNLRFQNLL